jgi:DNA-directed RNA polymerase specialized sigma24 family protein
MKYNSREVPYEISDLLLRIKNQTPENEWQALMEAEPNVEPSQNKKAIQILREAVVDCMDMLSPQDLMIIDAFNSERITYDELSKRLGVSIPHAWRLKKNAYCNLQEILLKNDIIIKYLKG